jgi:hypothetical protein
LELSDSECWNLAVPKHSDEGIPDGTQKHLEPPSNENRQESLLKQSEYKFREKSKLADTNEND